MRPTIRLGKILGIDVGLHWSILLTAGILVFTLTQTIFPLVVPDSSSATYLPVAIGTAVAFMASIVAHELGHSVVARNNKVGIAGITLFALGGVAQLEGEPRTPGAAARIALAGPLVSLVIGLGALFGPGLLGWTFSPVVDVAIEWLGLINLMLAIFNMMPALPLDGGRVLQAYLWKRKGDRQVATISAARLGRLLGWGIVALGIWQMTQGGSGFMTVFIGLFVISGAKAEARRARRIIRARQRPQGHAWPFGLFGFPPQRGPQQGVQNPFGPQQPTNPAGPSAPGGFGGSGRGDVVDTTSRPTEDTEDPMA